MLGRTHVAIGVAASLAILQPETVSECMCAVVGGGLGGWICDIDGRNNTAERQYPVQDALFMTLVVCLGLAVDYFAGDGVCSFFVSSGGVRTLVGGIGLAVLCIFGIASSHRSFMHSLFAMAASTALMWLFCQPIALAFLIGFASHIALDLFNKRGIQLFWPIKKGFALKVCDSNGTANTVIMTIGVVSSIALLGYFLIPSIHANQNLSSFTNPDFQLGGVPVFNLYLAAINIIAFLAFTMDYFVARKGISQYVSEGETASFLNILGFFGGGFGMLLAVLLWGKGIHKHNIGWVVYALCFSLIWGCLALAVYRPFGIPGAQNVSFNPSDHIILLVYLLLVIIEASPVSVGDSAPSR